MKSIKLCYADIYRKILSNKNTNQLNNIQQQLDDDISCSIRLLERGYSIDDIIEVLKKHSPATKKLSDSKAIAIYVDNVVNSINTERIQHANASYSKAVKTYKIRATTILYKYKDYNISNFGIFHDGRIAIAMIMDDGYPLSLINKVLREHSLCQNADTTYFSQLETSLRAVEVRYNRIIHFNPEQDITNTDTMYLRFAHKRLKECQNTHISGQDELKIIEELYYKIFANEKLRANRDAVMEDIFYPAIKQAIIENSPVYIEPGRNKEEYLQSIIESFMAKLTKDYILTEQCYKKQQEIAEQNINEFLTLHNNLFIDSIIAKNLLEEHHSLKNIKKAILQNSKQIVNDEKYADIIIERAASSLRAEKEIQNFKPSAIGTLRSSVKDLFLQMLKERIEAYPSFVFELAQPNTDRDAVEKLLKRFPECNRSELKTAIAETSPRAKLLGDSQHYAEQVLKLVDERIDQLRKRNKDKTEFENQYHKLRGLANEGVQSDNPMNSLKDGRTAVKMLRQGISQDDVREILTNIAKSAAIAAPAVYAGKILIKALATLAREQNIADFSGIAANSQENSTCEAAYTKKMQRQYKQAGIIKTSMDIETVRQLILEETFSKKEIKETVLNHSPNAVEPGRDDSYADYVENMAQAEIDREKEKLQRYIPMPRLNHDKDIKKEYDYQARKLMQMIKLPFCMAMDTIIGQTLLSEGFTALEIAKTMNENSRLLNPEQDINCTSLYAPIHSKFIAGNYGQQVLKIIKEKTETITEERNNGMLLSRTRTIDKNVTEVEDC